MRAAWDRLERISLDGGITNSLCCEANMLWVLQSNLFSERGYDRLIKAVERLECAHLFVKPIPFTTRLVPADFDASKAVDLDSVPDVEVDTTRPVLAMGSYSLAKTARARGWSPGAFLDNTSYDEWAVGFGHENVLNPHAWTGKFKDAVVKKPSFIRPLSDSKSFVGRVYDPGAFREWQAQVVGIGPDAYVNKDTEILVAEPREIWNETRCFVIDGRIVTASFYKQGGRARQEEVTEGPQLDFATECIARWVPSRAFVVDIAATPDGFKVVEVNCINAAGFYACDMQKLVMAFEDAFAT